MNENAVGSSQEASYSEPSVDTGSDYSEPADTDSGEVATDSSESNTVASVETEDGGMSVVKDPVTGKVSLQFGSDTDDTPQEEEQPQEATEPQGEAKPYADDAIEQGQQNLEFPKYNLEEFSHALANGYVDPNRVPEEYQAQYADYRIRQAIMERQAQEQRAAMQQEAQRREVEARMNPEARVQANKDFYKALEEEASVAALRDLGISQEQLNESEYTEEGDALKKDYENALSWHKQRLRSEMQARYQAEQNYKQQQQGLYANLSSFVAQERAKEPNFDAIDRVLATRYQTLPFEQGRMVAGALESLQKGTITQQDLQIIEDYYNSCRKEFYAQRNGLKPNGAKPAPKKPPVVENAGQGQKVNRSYKPNYKNLRNANVDQRSAWFSEYFKNNGW